MNKDQIAFIKAEHFHKLTKLHPFEAEGMNFYVKVNGWVSVSSTTPPNPFHTTDINIDGYFLITSIQHEEDTSLPDTQARRQKFIGSLSCKSGDIGMTTEKSITLFPDGDRQLNNAFFNFSLTKVFTASGEVISTNPQSIEGIYFTLEDLYIFSDSFGVPNIKEKVKALLPNIDPPQKSTKHSELNLHKQTSSQLYDLLEANNIFWELYDPDDPYTAPLKKQVLQWFIDKGYNKAIAEKMDTILRDGRNQPGGRPPNS
ncbi:MULTISPECIES: hypothetical protein [unclassified Neptuniibacter]|uniref:hypothetical protein n=1 Tax=unclassified Neptuniibacter TaxID=2630693 RepID=UPI0025E4553C|nr:MULTISPECIES: hypothetical protein [unclassified Neptuniibacter]|tara:strand:- start:715 stop:1488 length:774 start_codon:yes stop_codon:yes gene_type:complete